MDYNTNQEVFSAAAPPRSFLTATSWNTSNQCLLSRRRRTPT